MGAGKINISLRRHVIHTISGILLSHARRLKDGFVNKAELTKKIMASAPTSAPNAAAPAPAPARVGLRPRNQENQPNYSLTTRRGKKRSTGAIAPSLSIGEEIMSNETKSSATEVIMTQGDANNIFQIVGEPLEVGSTVIILFIKALSTY